MTDLKSQVTKDSLAGKSRQTAGGGSVLKFGTGYKIDSEY